MFEKRYLRQQMNEASAKPSDVVERTSDGKYKLALTDRKGKEYSILALVLSEFPSAKDDINDTITFTVEGYGYKPFSSSGTQATNQDVFGVRSIEILHEDSIKASILGYIRDHAGKFNALRRQHEQASQSCLQARMDLGGSSVFARNIDG